MRLKTLFKRFGYLLLIAGSLIGIARFCHHQTQGFRISKITNNFFSSESSENSPPLINSLLNQKFHFLSRGLQSFVFASEDGQYVIKLFNNRYQRKITLFSLLSHLPFLSFWAKKQCAYFEQKLFQTQMSYQIAFDEMQKETGLIYLHLFPTSELPAQLRLIDRLHICHTLDPNKIGFLIQKRVKPAYPAIKNYLDSGDISGAKRALSSLIHLFLWKMRQGIHDNDPLIRTNYGFIGTQAIQIDVGPLSKDNSVKSKELQITHLQKITTSLKSWLQENAPSLLPFLEQELEQQLSYEG